MNLEKSARLDRLREWADEQTRLRATRGCPVCGGRLWNGHHLDGPCRRPT